MILDLDGATTEPSRRRHVAVLSAAATAVSLVLLLVLFAPAPRTATLPVAPVSTASPLARMVVLSASGETTFVRLDQVAPQRDNETVSFCVAGIGSSPPVHLVLDGSGRLIAAYTSGKTGRFIPLPQVYVGSGWFTVPCDTSDVFAPRLNRAR